MSSTGEVACFGETLEEAFLKSIISVGFVLPPMGSKILVTLGRIRHKADFLPIAKKFKALGFSFVGTAGTADFLREYGFHCEKVEKIASGKHPNVAEEISEKKVSLVINTSNKFAHEEISDGYLIRRAVTDANIPLLTNLQLAKLLAKSLEKFPTADDLPIE